LSAGRLDGVERNRRAGKNAAGDRRASEPRARRDPPQRGRAREDAADVLPADRHRARGPREPDALGSRALEQGDPQDRRDRGLSYFAAGFGSGSGVDLPDEGSLQLYRGLLGTTVPPA